MNPDSEANEMGPRVRMLAMALLLSVLVVPVLLCLQSGEARAQRPPAQQVAAAVLEGAAPPDAAKPESGERLDAEQPAAQTHGAGPAQHTGTPPESPGVAAGSGPQAPARAPGVNAAPVRIAAPPDPFVPEPAPTGWRRTVSKPAGPLQVAALGARNEHPTETQTRSPKPANGPTVSPAPGKRLAGATPAVTARAALRPGTALSSAALKAQPAAKAVPVLPPTSLGDVRLRGIIRGAPDLALIRLAGQTYFLKSGDSVAGTWVVGEIKDNAVVLHSGDHVHELQIEGGSQT